MAPIGKPIAVPRSHGFHERFQSSFVIQLRHPLVTGMTSMPRALRISSASARMPSRWACTFGTALPEDEFDTIFARIKESGTRYYAYPDGSGEGRINTRDGGRGVYFDDPSGHAMEILTVPYGGWPS